MEFLLFLAFIVIMSVLRAAGQRQRQREPRLPHPSPEQLGQEPPQSVGDLLAEFRRAMEQAEAARRSGRESSLDDEFEEDVETLETEPEVRSLEDPVVRAEREPIDREREAEGLVARRIQWADAHGAPIRPADHRAFDQEIRQPPPMPEPTAEAARAARLRQLMIWREVLGPPVALREERGREVTPSPPQ